MSLRDNRVFHAQHSFGHAVSERGMVTLLFAAVLLPLIFIMLTVTVEFAHFFGIRNEIQRVIDREAHDALVRGSSEVDVVRVVQQRMRNITGMADVIEVRHFRAPARSVVRARAEYRGALFQFVQRYTGEERTVLPIALQSQVRIRSAASLVVVDRAVSPGAVPCSDPGLRAIGSFVDRLTRTWIDRAEARVAIGVTPGVTPIAPGVTAPVELLSNDGSDAFPRCEPTAGNPFNVSALEGSQGTPFDAFDVADALREIVSTEVVEQDREVRHVVLVLRRERYDQGYALSVFNMLQESMQGVPMAIDMYVVVLDDTGVIDSSPFTSGINGGAYREVGASIGELSGARLLGAMTQVVTDRIVLEN